MNTLPVGFGVLHRGTVPFVAFLEEFFSATPNDAEQLFFLTFFGGRALCHGLIPGNSS